jgi:hypothetical protein
MRDLLVGSEKTKTGELRVPVVYHCNKPPQLFRA